MRTLLAILFLVVAAPALAQDAPPTDESLRELLELSGAAKMLDQVRPQLEAMLEQTIQDATRDKDLAPEQEQVLADMRAELVALALEELSWERYEPMIMDIYRRSFSQAEVDGVVAFYRTDIGRALLAKMPIVMQHTMTTMRDNMSKMIAKVEAINKRARERLEALEPAGG